MDKEHQRRQVSNAFNDDSPSWNLPFPDGNLTAAEIIAYLPHYLKSVDVIDRFVTNGGSARLISYMINEFRHQPDDAYFKPNSVTVMMQYAMRKANFSEWTVRTHFNWRSNAEGDWNETILCVSNFRNPRITHPKGDGKHRRNREAAPIEFRDLALHIKKHPSGADALDLTRCIHYAVNNPHETWLFPVDFQRLVKLLGGPGDITHLHHDRQAFGRRIPGRSRPTISHSTTSNGKENPNGPVTPSGNAMARTRLATLGENSMATPQKHDHADDNSDIVDDTIAPREDKKRRSGRLATKAAIKFYDASDYDTTDKDVINNELSITRKRKLSDNFDDGDFSATEHDTSSSESFADNVSDELLAQSPTLRTARPAAKKARQAIQDMATPPVSHPMRAKKPSPPIDPLLLMAARSFDARKPAFLKPPTLSRDRLIVDSLSVHLYAEIGATDLWASALSSTRFNGPRRHPPFRELYRLTDPPAWDVSDWAENIRWAKEQHRFFGSTTWTEYDYHLEQIHEERMEKMWISEEAISGGN